MNELKLADGLVKLLSLVDIGNNGIQTGLHNADWAGRQNRALVIESGHQHGDAGVHFAKNVFDGDGAVREYKLRRVRAAHTQFVELFALCETREVAFHDECGDPARARVRRCFGVNHIGICVGPVGDPHFTAVEHVVIAVEVCA